MKVAQADEINRIFERQKKEIADLKKTIEDLKWLQQNKDSVIVSLVEKQVIDSTIAKRLDIIENWLYWASVEGSWIYFSYEDSLIYRVDLSNYKVRKDDNTGDLYFYWCEDYDKDNMSDEFIEYGESPLLNWEKDIRRSRRPKIEVVPIEH